MPNRTLSDYRKSADRLGMQRSHALKSVQAERAALDRAKRNRQQIAEAQQVLQQVAQTVQQEVHHRIAAVVSKCLQAVFDEPYEFKIEFERKRGRTEAKLTFVRDGWELDPKSATGGGVLDVTAFALRVACLVLTQPPIRRLIVADEPMKMLSAEFRPRVARMIEGLADDLGIQFILVTHSPELQVGKIIEIT